MVNEFNKAQQQVIDVVDGNVVVNATAGSGKTSVIIKNGEIKDNYSSICGGILLCIGFFYLFFSNINQRIIYIC